MPGPATCASTIRSSADPTIKPHIHQPLHSGEPLDDRRADVERHIAEHVRPARRRSVSTLPPEAAATRFEQIVVGKRVLLLERIVQDLDFERRAIDLRLVFLGGQLDPQRLARRAARQGVGQRQLDRRAAAGCLDSHAVSPPSGSVELLAPQRCMGPSRRFRAGRPAGHLKRRVVGLGFAPAASCGSTIAVDAVVPASGRRFRRRSPPAP